MLLWNLLRFFLHTNDSWNLTPLKEAIHLEYGSGCLVKLLLSRGNIMWTYHVEDMDWWHRSFVPLQELGKYALLCH